jgi:DUF1680 family protein
MKLCNQLLTLTGDPKYARYIEESYYNALLGAVNTEGAGEGFSFDSYSPLFLGQRCRAVGGRMYFPEGGSYGCCVAIGAAGTSLPILTAVTVTKGGIAVNYYEKGRVNIQGFTLEIDTNYPLSGEITIKVLSAPEGVSEIALRVPYFGGEDTEVSYGGGYIYSVSTPDSYCKIKRCWNKNDTVSLKIDMNPRIVRPVGCMAIDKTRKFLAVKYGPLVMARDKRVSEVGKEVKLDTLGGFEISSTDRVKCNLFAKAKIGEETLLLIDYASAGKTLDENSLTEAWIPTDRTELF